MSDVLILTASNGKNLELANELKNIGSEIGVSSEVLNLVDWDLPLYSPKAEADGIPGSALDLTTKIENAKSLFFLAPEYNGSIPPVLNNAIAWISRSKEEWRSAFNGKVAAIGSHSGSGGPLVLSAMRTQLSYIGVNVLGRQLMTHYSKSLNPDSAKAILEELKKIS